jgi:hypothetical protein
MSTGVRFSALYAAWLVACLSEMHDSDGYAIFWDGVVSRRHGECK